MKLTILGSGTHIPEKNRSNPAYLLDINGETILLDCGSGSLRQIVKAGRSEWEIDKIFLSHMHIDHIMDFVPLFFTFKYQKDKQATKKVVPVFAHSEFENYFKKIEAIYGRWINAETRQYELVKLLPNQNLQYGFQIETFKAEHSENSLIFRFTDRNNHTFVYTGDTSPSENLIRAAYRADLLLIECSGRDDLTIKGHLAPKDVKIILSATKVKTAVITHIHPLNDNEELHSKLKTPNTNVIIAEDLAIIDLNI